MLEWLCTYLTVRNDGFYNCPKKECCLNFATWVKTADNVGWEYEYNFMKTIVLMQKIIR